MTIDGRQLNDAGIAKFREWLEHRTPGPPPVSLLEGSELALPLEGVSLDPLKLFDSRLEFGKYLSESLSSRSIAEMLSPALDGFWAWVAVLYFAQLSAKGIRRAEHYVVTRRGAAGSLTHRHAARTAYWLFALHGEDARICLRQPMHTLGQTLESLSAKQAVIRNRSFFKVATLMYFDEDKWVRGATSKLERPSKRKLGDTSGKGGVRRLPRALGRLDLTHDVEIMGASDLLARLPREFARFRNRQSKTAPAH